MVKFTVVDPDSFWGKLRSIYSTKVLKTQLEQLRKQGSIDAFKHEWNPVYDVRRTKGGMAIVSPTTENLIYGLRLIRSQPDGIPPSLAWESDVAKWYAPELFRHLNFMS